ncbi:MAG: hypothetical protein K9N07_10340 [Candidatus Cloacimonetes bacterium]|nr:hypothetical protein [Candidatus Cloacimonadota bacterium]MCF8012738.1 hypothetical protein [Candidatus Woesearchaeota archaeon]
MTSNNESNYGNSYSPSPSFIKNKGRLSRLPPEERSRIARKGGLAKSEKKKLSSQLNPIKTGGATKALPISKCNDCPIKEICHFYKEDTACSIELNVYRSMAQEFKAFIGNDPKDILIKIMKTYMVLEKEVSINPSEYKLMQQIYLLMKIYEMKFGKASFRLNIEKPINTSEDIKELMNELRE